MLVLSFQGWRSHPKQTTRQRCSYHSINQIDWLPLCCRHILPKEEECLEIHPAHNHPPSLYAAAHTTKQKLTSSLYKEMMKLGEAGLKPAAILEAIKKRHSDQQILANISKIYAARLQALKEYLQGLSPISHLNKTLLNTNFTTATKVDDVGTLQALFFCHA